MAADFDPSDKQSWYFGPLSRDDTSSLLTAERISGTFLVRDSNTIKGDYVLSVKEDNKVSHYIINKIDKGDSQCLRIGDHDFSDIPALLAFYKTHYLDTTSLIRVATRQKYIGKFDFNSEDPEDLSFKKGDILVILTKDQAEWWTAKNESGRTGLIPNNYIEEYDPEGPIMPPPPPPPIDSPPDPVFGSGDQPHRRRTLPAMARVSQQRIPNAYDSTALALNVGDRVLVTAMNRNGEWEGEMNGKKGFFPFKYIEFVDDETEDAGS